MSTIFLISDAAKKVEVEAHVLRYWEEELELPIKRNELGHRYYTEEDVKRFQEIKELKERGLQLKAIRVILKDGELNVLPKEPVVQEKQYQPPAESLSKTTGTYRQTDIAVQGGNAEDKAQRLQWLLKQLFKETLQENNEYLCREMKESILKELDYQFRMQEERADEREAEKLKRDEEHFKRIDEMLRKKRRLLKK